MLGSHKYLVGYQFSCWTKPAIHQFSKTLEVLIDYFFAIITAEIGALRFKKQTPLLTFFVRDLIALLLFCIWKSKLVAGFVINHLCNFTKNMLFKKRKYNETLDCLEHFAQTTF